MHVQRSTVNIQYMAADRKVIRSGPWNFFTTFGVVPARSTFLFIKGMRKYLFPHPLFCLCALLPAGCDRYQPLPLNQQTIDAKLAVPDDSDLHARIAGLHNPLLKPLEMRPGEGLTPDQAAVLAVVINPALRAQQDEHLSSQAALLQAGILPNPQLTYSYDWNTGGTALGNINAYGIGVAWDITALISHTAKARSASWAARSVDLNIAWQEWLVAETAKTATLDLISLQAQRQVAGDVDQRLSDNLQVIQSAVNQGLKTAIDLAAAETASRDAHAIVLQTDRDVEHQLLMLKRALGVPWDTAIRVKPGLALSAGFTPPPESELLSGLEDRRVDLVALRQAYQAQEQTLVAADLDQFPKINLGFNRARDNTNVRSWGLGVSIDIPVFDRNQGSIASEKANRQRMYDEYISRVFDARADIAAAVSDILAINVQIADAQAALPSLQKLVDVYKEAIDRGNADVLSYYSAWDNLSQKNLDLLKLEQQLADNRVALEIASGRYFPQEVGTGTTRPTTLPNPAETKP